MNHLIHKQGCDIRKVPNKSSYQLDDPSYAIGTLSITYMTIHENELKDVRIFVSFKLISRKFIQF